MHLISSILMGLIQGFTEFLPISSSGHLVLFQHFFQHGAADNKDISLEVILHFGSLIAVLVYFWKDILDLLNSWLHWKKTIDQNRQVRNRMIAVYIVISTIVTGIIYVLLGDRIENMFANPFLVAIMLSISGIIVFCSDLVKKSEIPIANMGTMRSILIGLGQGIAMIPGISRSGTTISTSLFLGIKRSEAARYSFLLSIPAILAANVKELKVVSHLDHSLLLSYIFGAVAAFIAGYIVIAFLIRLIQNSKLKYFAYYCWFISALSITLLINHF